MSSTTYEGLLISAAVTSVTWYSTARWFANQISVGLSSHNAYRTSRLDVSAHIATVRTNDGA